jgi:hypothetical protein
MSYPEVPFKVRVIEGTSRFTKGEEIYIHKVVEWVCGGLFFQTEFDKRPEWHHSRFEVIQKPEETKDLAYYQKLFPSGAKFQVVCSDDEGLWAKFGEEYTVGDCIKVSDDGIAVRPQERLSKGYNSSWISIERCELVCEETPNIETSDEPQFKVTCTQTYTLTIKGVTFELTSDEFTELERAMEDF